MEIKRIAIVGMGAVGLLLADYLTKALGDDAVRFVADSDRASRYERDGVFVNGEKRRFSVTQDWKNPADLVIFAVKAPQLEEAIALAADWVGTDTILLSVLNGVTSEEALIAAFGQDKVIYTVAQGMDAAKEGNRMTYRMPGELRIGLTQEQYGMEEKLEAVRVLLETAQFPYVVEEDILHRMWSKFMLNVGVNQVCMVFENNYGGVQAPGEARDTMIAAMDEARKMAACAGQLITRKELDDYVALVDSLTPEGMPSMRQDALAKRKSEVELFSGTVLRMAKDFGMRAPVNRKLYDRIQALEAAYEKTAL